MVRPGPMVDGPGPGVLPLLASPTAHAAAMKTTQVRFVGPAGMAVGWIVPGGFAENQLVTPARYNFPQNATYRLKLGNVPDREGLALYPTLQVYPADPNTDAYLSHNSVPIEITVEDLDQVESNNFVTKVIYLPDPRYQDLAIPGVETLVSTRLDPGVDPVHEASRRGTIMAVLRMGNADLEVAGPPRPAGPGMPPIEQMSHSVADGAAGQFYPPLAIASIEGGAIGVPSPMIVGDRSLPGRPAMHPVAGVGPVPSWGDPITGTPIGLPGPPHLPYGGPAGLQSHTVRNLTKVDLGQPVDHMLIDVKHEPGLSLPKPVKYVYYEEEHPELNPEEINYGGGAAGGYCPPGMAPGAGGFVPPANGVYYPQQ
ncbi:MAG: hypothetical protein H0T47_24320 [Planctomycetaceae bacterium]|nr:hypothetical protein [Planctomycetaceae bacterium]